MVAVGIICFFFGTIVGIFMAALLHAADSGEEQ